MLSRFQREPIQYFDGTVTFSNLKIIAGHRAREELVLCLVAEVGVGGCRTHLHDLEQTKQVGNLDSCWG